jgi:hypothetical protein
MFVLTQLRDTVLVQASELSKGEIIVFRIEQQLHMKYSNK